MVARSVGALLNNQAVAISAAPAASEGQGWRDALRGYLPGDDRPPPDGATADPTPLALQFELRELVPRSSTRWNGPVSKSVRPIPGALRQDHRLAVRPVARTSRGWAQQGITWTNIQHLVNRQNLDIDQHRWFCEVGALHRALGVTAPGRDPDWIYLDEFANPVLWTLLDQAPQLAINLVGAGANAIVRRAIEATLTLDATHTRTGIELAPRLTLDDQAAAVTHARPIGSHGIYLVDPATPRHIVIARTREPLTSDHLTIIRTSTTGVPDGDIPEFFADYLPDLQERIDVTSSDASVTLPPPTPPILVASVTHAAKHTLTVTWHWQGGHRSTPTPALDQLLPAGLLPDQWLPAGPLPREVPLCATLTGIDAAEFAAHTLRTLRNLPGVRVETHGVAPHYRELTGTPQLVVTTIPSEQNDWFDLGVTVTVDGKTIPFLPLFKALAKGRRTLLLVDGSYLSLLHPALRALSDLIEESRNLDGWNPVPSLSRHQIGLWSDFEDLAEESTPAVEWRALLADTRSDTPRPITPPAGLHATLRPYQQDGFNWLAYLWRHQLGGVLADDMGLGKTVQCLALIQHALDTADRRKPFLVVAPTSVMTNWVTEANRFTPDLVIRQVTTTESAGRTAIADAIRGADIVITSYALLRLNFDAYQAVAQSTGWAALVLDEAQFVKNPTSKVHAAALDLAVRFKLAVTGTPLENSLTDLQALFAIVAPGLLASARRFQRDYVRPIQEPHSGITSGVGAGSAEVVNAATRVERIGKLRRRIRPFLLRRTKELVAADLPAKQEQILRIDLAPDHRDLYQLFLQRERQQLFTLLAEEDDRNKYIVLRSLTLLRLLALDASLIGDEYAEFPSAKLDALVELLDDVIVEGHRALVFSQFTSYLTKVSSRLDKSGIEYSYLDGSTVDRGAVIDKFKSGSAPVFLISLKAGGFGLNLTEADYVFLLDPWWNPAREDQAIDRTHRIGQEKPVMVYRLVAADTIEEKVLALQQRKADLFDLVIGDDALFSNSLTNEDIRELLT